MLSLSGILYAQPLRSFLPALLTLNQSHILSSSVLSKISISVLVFCSSSFAFHKFRLFISPSGLVCRGKVMFIFLLFLMSVGCVQSHGIFRSCDSLHPCHEVTRNLSRWFDVLDIVASMTESTEGYTVRRSEGIVLDPFAYSSIYMVHQNFKAHPKITIQTLSLSLFFICTDYL